MLNMSLQINKCPICLKRAVDYRHIELVARFGLIIQFPQCQFCYAIPPSHFTPENVKSTDQVKMLIELINYHIERSDKYDSFREIVNWKAITFAFQVYFKRFQLSNIITLESKLGFPIMNANKLNEILNKLNESQISSLDEVQQEIKIIKQHQEMEQKFINNQLEPLDRDQIYYYLNKCGADLEMEIPKEKQYEKEETTIQKGESKPENVQINFDKSFEKKGPITRKIKGKEKEKSKEEAKKQEIQECEGKRITRKQNRKEMEWNWKHCLGDFERKVRISERKKDQKKDGQLEQKQSERQQLSLI